VLAIVSTAVTLIGKQVGKPRTAFNGVRSSWLMVEMN